MIRRNDINDIIHKMVFCIHLLCIAAVMLVMGTSCENTLDELKSQPVKCVTVKLVTESELQTRTGLPIHDGNDLAGVQHVTDVYVYIFEKDDNGTDYTCKGMCDVHWSELVERENGKLPTTTKSLTYNIPYGFKEDKTYKLVAIGLDCAESSEEMQDYDGHNSAKTYGLPGTIKEGTKLSQAFAELQPGCDTQDLMHSEFFSGASVDFKTTANSTKLNIGEIELRRRVAGLQICLDRIPEDIERIRVLLYNSQNTRTCILKSTPDFITSPYNSDINSEEGRVLLDLGQEYFENSQSGTVMFGGMTYKCSGTVFLLPVDKPDKEKYDYTLMLEFITTSITGVVGETKKVRLTKPGNDSSLDFEDNYDIGTGIIDDLNKYLFPIEANHFYCLGMPSQAIDCSKIF